MKCALAIPGKVVETYREHDVLMGKVDFGGVSKRVCLEHVPEVQLGEYVIVHVGFALSVIDEAEAKQVFAFLRKMNELDDVTVDQSAVGEDEKGEMSQRTTSMKFQDEYRDPVRPRKLRQAIHRATTRPWTIMEVCGGQTHTIVKYGIDELLPPQIELVHGPGCPVCVTPLEMIDKAIAIASRPDVIFCSFGDMLRVPGSRSDLFDGQGGGGDVRIVYSPLDCLKIAEPNPGRTVVFFAVGFETTAPANAMAVWQAKRRGIKNFAVLVSHVLVPPAMTAILSSPGNRVQAFLAAGHVCTVMGYEEYEPLAERFRVPIVVTGFEPLDLLEGVYRAVQCSKNGVSRWRISTSALFAAKEVLRRGNCSTTCSRSATANGAASARFRRAVIGCGPTTPSSTPNSALGSRTFWSANRMCASAD